MRVANGVDMLELTVEAFGRRMALHPTLIWDEDGAILIDAGMPGQFEQIREAMDQAGVSLDQLKAVIVTHQDIDHIGGLPELLRECGGCVKVYAHELDKPYIEGRLPLIKADPSRMPKEKWEQIPEEVRALYTHPPKAYVDEVLGDQQELPYCGGIRVVFTPGHTPGHISLYLQQSKIIVAGDAIVCADGQLRGPVPENTPDMATALRSLEAFLDLDVEAVICYHGGLCCGDVKNQLRQLVTSANR